MRADDVRFAAVVFVTDADPRHIRRADGHSDADAIGDDERVTHCAVAQPDSVTEPHAHAVTHADVRADADDRRARAVLRGR